MHSQRASFSGALLLAAMTLGPVAPSEAVVPNGKLQIVHLDAGQADAAVLITPLGQVAMIDDGGAVYPSFPCSKILAQLDTLGIAHIDYHFASHYHADHIGCFSTVDNVVSFDEGWDRAGSYGTATYTSYVNALGARRHTLVEGQVFTLDAGSAHPVTITCVDFNGAGSDDYENSKSIVLRVDYGHFSESFGGDLDGYAGSGRYDYETPFSSEVGPVMVYKVHHHSSKYSTNDTWLNNTAPMVGIISLGDGNSYGFPTPEALGRLHNHQVHTYWTERGSASGASPDPNWDKVAHGRIAINAVWEGQGKTVISGGYGASAFSDTLTNPGLPPVGACCDRNTGSCALTIENDCAAPSMWHSEWTACSPNPCAPPPEGACCYPPYDLCIVVTHATCDSLNGQYIGDSVPCDPLPCPVRGACCLPAGQCLLAYPVDCSVQGGTYQGDAHPCDPDPCSSSGLVEVGGAGADAFISAVPNPSSGSTALSYRLSRDGQVRLEIYDAGGRAIRILEPGTVAAGIHSVEWDGRGSGGDPVSPGVYFARLSAGERSWVRTLIRIR